MSFSTPLGRKRLFWLAVGVLSLFALGLRSLALILDLDAEIGYFAKGATLPVIVHVLEGLALVLCFVPFWLLRGEKPSDLTPPRLAERICMGVAAAGALAPIVYFILQPTPLPAPGALGVLAAIFLLFGAIHFLLLIRHRTESAAMWGYGMILGAVLLLSITYFDRYTQMNAPHKVSVHLCMLSIMLCMLFLIRPLIGCARPLGQVASTALCLFCTLVYGGSNLIGFIAGVYTDPLYLSVDVVSLCFAVYLIGRIVVSLMPAKEPSVPTQAEEQA